MDNHDPNKMNFKVPSKSEKKSRKRLRNEIEESNDENNSRISDLPNPATKRRKIISNSRHNESRSICASAIHIDEKIFVCNAPHCESTFTTESKLKEHSQLEHPKGPYPCPYCKSSFKKQKTAIRHLKQAHNVEEDEFPRKEYLDVNRVAIIRRPLRSKSYKKIPSIINVKFKLSPPCSSVPPNEPLAFASQCNDKNVVSCMEKMASLDEEMQQITRQEPNENAIPHPVSNWDFLAKTATAPESFIFSREMHSFNPYTASQTFFSSRNHEMLSHEPIPSSSVGFSTVAQPTMFENSTIVHDNSIASYIPDTWRPNALHQIGSNNNELWCTLPGHGVPLSASMVAEKTSINNINSYNSNNNGFEYLAFDTLNSNWNSNHNDYRHFNGCCNICNPVNTGATTSNISNPTFGNTLPKCHLCSATGPLLLCDGCNTVYYCCKEHQEFDNKDHKTICTQVNNLREIQTSLQQQMQQLIQNS